MQHAVVRPNVIVRRRSWREHASRRRRRQRSRRQVRGHLHAWRRWSAKWCSCARRRAAPGRGPCHRRERLFCASRHISILTASAHHASHIASFPGSVPHAPRRPWPLLPGSCAVLLLHLFQRQWAPACCHLTLTFIHTSVYALCSEPQPHAWRQVQGHAHGQFLCAMPALEHISACPAGAACWRAWAWTAGGRRAWAARVWAAAELAQRAALTWRPAWARRRAAGYLAAPPAGALPVCAL